MSTRIGTLQPKARTGQPVWPVALLALLVVATFVAIVMTNDRYRPRDETTSVGGTAANTPTELSGGIVGSTIGNTAANTPTELSGGIVGSTFGNTAANTPTELSGGISFPAVSGTLANTPTELTGGISFAAGTSAALTARAKQLGVDVEFGGTQVGTGSSEPIVVGGEVCEICWKYR